MVQVKVHRISSVTDPYTGLPAKQIELVEVRQRAASGQVYGMGAEENRLVQNMVSQLQGDRKSTRLNSSHSSISYAVFCLKKKKKLSNRYISRNDARIVGR